jgi:hypothetical protein
MLSALPTWGEKQLEMMRICRRLFARSIADLEESMEEQDNTLPTQVASGVASDTCTPEEREQEIRDAAYQLYVERGQEDGHDVEDWLQAEAIWDRSKIAE